MIRSTSACSLSAARAGFRSSRSCRSSIAAVMRLSVRPRRASSSRCRSGTASTDRSPRCARWATPASQAGPRPAVRQSTRQTHKTAPPAVPPPAPAGNCASAVRGWRRARLAHHHEQVGSAGAGVSSQRINAVKALGIRPSNRLAAALPHRFAHRRVGRWLATAARPAGRRQHHALAVDHQQRAPRDGRRPPALPAWR